MAYDQPGRAASAEQGVPTAVLENVFDDPTHGEPGRDRVAVHVVWELLLLLALAGLAYLLWQVDADALRGDRLRTFLVDVVALGLLALAAGLSLRTAAVNLAVGPVAVAAGLHLAEQGDRGLQEALVPALAVAALGGLALALAVVVLHVPGWAASLAGAAGVIVWIEQRTAPVALQGDHDPRAVAVRLFAGFAAVSVLAGLFGAIRAVRRLVGRFRPVVDPARRRGTVAAVVTATALVCSTVLAMLAGALLAANGTGPVVPATGLDWTVLAVGVAMLGGTSAYGRRGGVLGTLLAVSLVVVLLAWTAAEGRTLSRWAVGGAALAVGLVVTRLVEAYGRPRAAPGEPVEVVPVSDGSISSGWTLARPGPADTWTPALPTPATDTPPDPWEAPRWDTGPGRWDDRDR
ncbi:ABC transporter permease [Micromonospora coxensis]|uniref:Monosaccharide ABC transporter membrane protein, CUT2 family n=1 Tax=Micromonospora coxensis TaxID=356852 RepID=A0A1C5IJ56_9ACTN|nr:ABC transporter permease [Micromonospora coxensis]SCG58422.1 monosaccharide ABC transporter membrane protein, CUT2 family [Micromonospora coxensis]